MTAPQTTSLAQPAYSEQECQIGIVHIGFGAFHRAHQAVYVDDYMAQSGDLRWGIAAVNLRAAEAENFAKSAANKDGYVLKTISAAGETNNRVVKAHRAFLDWSTDRAATEAVLSNPSVHMVSITVTESGYYLDDAGKLNTADPIIAAELNGETPKSIYGYLANSLRLRMNSDGGKITIMCCDNIRHNGTMLRTNLMAYLTLSGQKDLADWLGQNASFPCSMVDRITPRPPAELSGEIEALFGRKNDQAVMGEDFIQWVIEDDFAGPMPDLTKVGATVTKNVDPYEETKIRILNGGHTCLTYLGALAGYKTFDQAMFDPELFDHFWSYETKEVLPAITIDLPFDKVKYLEKIAERFKNQNIADSVERICADGYSKFPIFIQPTLAGCLKQGIMPIHGIRSIASWYVFAKRVKTGQLQAGYNEPNAQHLNPLLEDGAETTFAKSEMLWADLPKKYPEFATEILTQIKEMDTRWPV